MGPGKELANKRPVTLFLRPERIHLGSEADRGATSWKGLRPTWFITATTHGFSSTWQAVPGWYEDSANRFDLTEMCVGAKVLLGFDPEGIMVIG